MAQEPSVRLRSAALLRELMAAANGGSGYSYRDMADRLPCGKTMVGELATGVTATCTESLGDRIAEVLGVPTRVLFAPAPSVKRGRPPTIRTQVPA
jgi:hypothetical protein